MSKSKNALMGAVLAGALLPGAAHAAPTIDASAVVKATVRADVNLDRAVELADSTRGAAQRRARELHQRSRAQINAAAAKTRVLVRRAQQTGESAAATEATVHLTAALDADARGQVAIAAVADGRLQSAATKALAADAKLELKANLALASLAAETKDEAAVIEALGPQLAGQASDVATDLQAATSGRLSKTAQASADLAVAIDTKASAVYADALARLHTTTEESVKPALAEISRAIAEQADRIRGEIERSTAAPHTVTFSGSVGVTLAGLAIASGEASASGVLGLDGGQASANGEARGQLSLPGLLG